MTSGHVSRAALVSASSNPMTKTLSLGSVATNLSSPRQTFVVCLALLSDINPNLAAKHRAKAICKMVDSGADLSLVERYQLSRAVSALLHDLNRHAPPLTYVGYQANDPSHLGVWIDLDALHQAEVAGTLVQVVGGSWAGSRSTFVLDMSDKGLTLYRRRGKVAIWSMS